RCQCRDSCLLALPLLTPNPPRQESEARRRSKRQRRQCQQHNIHFPAPLPQRELDCDFDQHVHGHAFALRGREAPLTHRADSALVQPIAKALQHVGVSDTAVTPHDDLEDDIASDAAPSRVFRILRLHLVQQPRWLEAAAWPIGATTGAASLSLTNAGTEPLAIARTLTGSNATVRTRPVAVTCFHGMLDLTHALHLVGGYGFHGSNDFLRRLRFGCLLFRDDNRFRLFHRRHRELWTRPLGFPQDLRRRLRVGRVAPPPRARPP